MGDWRTVMSKKSQRRWNTRKKVVSRIPFLLRLEKSFGFSASDRKIGRCRRHHPYDCGHTRCFACHYEKISKKPTKNQYTSDLYLKESLLEL